MNNFSFYKDGKALYCLFFMAILVTFSSVQANNAKRYSSLFFQQHQILGTVTDGNNPLPGVTISIKNNPNVTAITDYTGQYTISASTDDVLIVSYIGFKTVLIPVQGRSAINIKLDYDTTTLQEVRVNAGYYSVKESERTGSISRITSKDIENQPVTNILATMQGRMAGVSITQSTGVPGGGFDIKIRGQNSIRPDANAPLYIVDGVPYASDPIGSNYTATSFPSVTSPLNNINTENIESIEVLKDADATAIYGSKGANGIVLITTKKGKTGKTTFSFASSTGMGTVTKFLTLMNTSQYLAMRKQAFINDGRTDYGETDYDVNGVWDQNRYTDWQKELLGGTSLITDIQGTIAGGSDNTQFMVSGNIHKESTVFPGDFIYKKAGSQLNLNHRSENNRFKMTLSAGYNIVNNNQPSYDFSYDARALSPNAPALYDSNGDLNWENGTWENPLRNLNTEFVSKTNDFLANIVLSYDLRPGLVLKSSFGYTDLSNFETRIIPSTISNPDYNISSATSAIFLNNTQRSSWIIEPQLNWTANLFSGKLNMLLGSTFQNQGTSKLYQLGIGFTSNSLIYNLAAANTIQIILNDETLYKYQALFARLNYSLLDRYIINFTARRDGSSRFGPGNQFANFGAIGGAWLFFKENFMKNSTWLSFGKIRSSYGITGNDQIGDYQFLNTYTTSGLIYDGATGLQPTRLYNPDFAWETNKKFEAAMELGFFKDRVFFTSAFYQNRSSNQLTGIPIPGTTGFTSLQSNLAATVQNSGLEFTLRTVNINNGRLNWTTALNFTSARNKLVSFPKLESSTYRQRYRIGQPLNIKLLYNYTGVDTQTGLYKFEDINKDSKITSPDDKQIVADLTPEFYGGLQNQITWKGISLDFLFQFVKQKNSLYPMGPAGMMSNQQVRMTESWSNQNNLSAYQIYTTGYNNDAVNADYLYTQSTSSIVDASYIRLKNIALSYELPLHLSTSKCRIILQGQNLLTFTKYTDGDPEFTSYGYLPPLKVITAGIQLTF